MNGGGDSGKNRYGRGRFFGAQLFWVGPGELVVLDVVHTGRIGVEAVLLSLVGLLAALATVPSIRFGVRAAVDLVARLVFLPSHAWSTAVVVLDVAVIAVAWHTAGRGGGGQARR